MKRFFIFFIAAVSAATLSAADVVMPEGVTKDRMASELLWKGFLKTNPDERPRIVLALGGGGARGLSHIGVLRVIEDERIPVDEMVGVSVGALIGSLYAAGFTADRIEGMATEIGWNKLSDYSRATMMRLVFSEELMSTGGMEQYLNSHMGEKKFSDLSIPFACVATDIRTGERVVFNEGPVAIAARASATIPAVFKPVEYRHRLLVDGGLVDNLPTDIAHVREDWDVVVGVLPKSDLSVSEGSTIFKSLVRAIEIQRDVIVRERREKADLIIEPDVGDIGIADLFRSKDLIQDGTTAARRGALDLKRIALKRLLSKKPVEVGQR